VLRGPAIRLIPLSLLAFACARHSTAGTPSLTSGDLAMGWRLLFDGTTTAGWRGYKSDTMPAGWQVVDGALTRVAGGGDIVTKDQFGSFLLVLEWKVAPGGNSGIMYHVVEDSSETYFSGPEMQVLDDARHRDGRSRLTSAGSAYGLYPAPGGVVKPAGQWNQVRLLVNGPHVEHWLNGVKVCEYELWSEDWNARVAGSKFKQWPGFGEARTGHIALQDHGDRVAYRNIKIRVLP
jgi:3-keto-disaccharide hydrolase